ncbi:MAG: 1-deoxy-D-xylulose-5-phosphate reductoisomerase [Candidatus Cloacimonetes bacterium]|nr:1-deoxy-D-xylulose-5-phosphate reductoisomerase [Candidatus Cloacimonadota bacterium]
MKKIAILGITGSIGISAIDVVRSHPDKFKIVLASAHNNFTKLLEISNEFLIPDIVLINQDLKDKIDNLPKSSNLYFGKEELGKILENCDCDLVLNAISGSAGLTYSMIAISRNLDIALANKESLVMAGHLIEEALKTSKSRLIPVDSEHSAILQAISSNSMEQVRSIILTASGGPFRELPLSKFKDITIDQTLAHPTWNMGAKITVDSATMMNKGLEVIEAHWLFQKRYSQIKTVIHPQSIIHSMVEFVDGSLIAQMSTPTMKLPILYAFSYPDHIDSDLSHTDIYNLPELSFSDVERQRFPLFFLACEVGKSGGLMPTIMNAANEAAIDLFLNKKIRYIRIYKLIEKIINSEENISAPVLETITGSNSEIYRKVIGNYKKYI